MKKYIVDTNVLIDLEGFHNTIGLPKHFIEDIRSFFNNGTIISHKLVLKEFLAGNNNKLDPNDRPIKELVNQNHTAFREENDLQFFHFFTEVSNSLGIKPQENQEKDKADLYLIALAKFYNHSAFGVTNGGDEYVVLTQENKEKPGSIPKLCEKNQVGCINFKQFEKEVGLSL